MIQLKISYHLDSYGTFYIKNIDKHIGPKPKSLLRYIRIVKISNILNIRKKKNWYMGSCIILRRNGWTSKYDKSCIFNGTTEKVLKNYPLKRIFISSSTSVAPLFNKYCIISSISYSFATLNARSLRA